MKMKSTMELALVHSSYDGDMAVAVGLNSAQSQGMAMAFKVLTTTFRRAAGLTGVNDIIAVCTGYEKTTNEQGTSHRFSGEIKGAPVGHISSSYVKHKIKGEKMYLVDSERVKILNEQQISQDEVALISQLIDEAIAIVKKAMDKGKQQELFDAINGVGEAFGGLVEHVRKEGGKVYVGDTEEKISLDDDEDEEDEEDD